MPEFYFIIKRFFPSDADFYEITEQIKLGDIIGVTGSAITNKNKRIKHKT